ncbi:MAG: hypothetical protein WCI47_01080 [bacterium]
MNLNLKLDLNGNVLTWLKKIAEHLHIVLIIVFSLVLAYSIYFAVNLFYSKGDLDALANKQTTERSKQIRFNQKTIDSLDRLLPARTEAPTPENGRSNPFAPL